MAPFSQSSTLAETKYEESCITTSECHYEQRLLLQIWQKVTATNFTSARQRRTSGYGRPMHGEHSTTSRIVGTLPCLMTSKEQSSWPRWNPSCYVVQRHGRLLQCKKLGSMAATQVCSGWCSTLHGGIGSGMRSSMEISLETLQKSGSEDFEWTVCPTPRIGCKQPRSMGTDAGTSFTRRLVFDFYRPAPARY